MKKTKSAEKTLHRANDMITDQVFNSMYEKKWQVYWLNFFRGIFFGVGSVLGGTLVIAVIAWILGLFVDLPGGVGDLVQFIVDQVQGAQ